jgi:PTS system nitrogen regulatory IIA component
MHLVHFPAIKSFLNQMVGAEHRHGHSGRSEEAPMKSIADLLTPQDIALDVVVSGKSELLDEIGQHMESVHGIPEGSVIRSLAHREQIGSTALGQGIAIPHARIKELDRIQLMYLRLRLPVPFNAPDGKPVADVLVILVPKLATQEHLQILAETSQMFSDHVFRERLHRCTNPVQVKQLFDCWPKGSF